MKRTKKYNNQTGCYKIDIFVNGQYACSTDQSKTCRQAAQRYRELHKLPDPLEASELTEVKAYFDYY
jgi:hypothetical protein